MKIMKEGEKEGSSTYKSVLFTVKTYIVSVLKEQVKLESRAKEEKLCICWCDM
jgi:hypothetical protein